jgi:hypothetical protein
MIHKIFAQILTLSLLLILSNAGCSFSPQSSLELDVLHDGTLIDGTASQRITFLLLNEDPIYLAMNLDDEKGLLSSTYPRLKVLAGKLNARRFGGYSLGPDVFLLLDQSRPLWEPHVIRSMQTNLDGHSQVDGLKPGKYWLMAYRQTKTNEAFWLQAVMINVDTTKVVLERSNALYSKSEP